MYLLSLPPSVKVYHPSDISHAPLIVATLEQIRHYQVAVAYWHSGHESPFFPVKR
jgi:hypothetical protein